MSRTYNAVGINLKAMALGESDRLLTILTREQGLIRAVAPGARKPRSKLRGNSGLFFVNQLFLAKGRSLDKITQAETIKSYSGLSQNLGKLAASQYLAELVLAIALSEQPQEELFLVLNEHLNRLEQLKTSSERQTCRLVMACLVHGIFHLLALAGVAPQVQFCNLTQRLIEPNFNQLQWQVGFSIAGGGIVSLSDWHQYPQKTDFCAKVAERSEGIPSNRKISLNLELILD
jgi:DNA repair protein RecO (recombination protein O)